MSKVAFLGLGVMGFPMAGHLKTRGGHDVVVYNRTAAKAAKWVERFGGASAPRPRRRRKDCDFVFACVGNDHDVRAVTIGEGGAFAGMRAGRRLRRSYDRVRQCRARARRARRSAKASGFIDAPVSGGQAGAENGQLTVMCGGEPADYARVEPVIAAYARSCRLMGASGSGQLTKMVNQICIAGLVQALVGRLHFAQAAELDPLAVVEVISKGAAQSWQMENRHKTMAAGEFGFGFAVDWMRKDLAICLDEARRNGPPLPVTALVDQFYGDDTGQGRRPLGYVEPHHPPLNESSA